MSIVSASSLSAADCRQLGNNVGPAISRDRVSVAAVNRSLGMHDEKVDRLYRRAGGSRSERLRQRV
jgi:hypothetical protein